MRDAGFASYACPNLKKLEQLLKDMKAHSIRIVGGIQGCLVR